MYLRSAFLTLAAALALCAQEQAPGSRGGVPGATPGIRPNRMNSWSRWARASR